MEKNKTVLIVEDDKSYRELLSEALKNEHMTVLEAENGNVALKILEDTYPDLMLLDLMMPEMTGWGFMYKLQETDKKHIPIIILTNLSDTSYPSELPTQVEFLVKANISISGVVEKAKKILRI